MLITQNSGQRREVVFCGLLCQFYTQNKVFSYFRICNSLGKLQSYTKKAEG